MVEELRFGSRAGKREVVWVLTLVYSGYPTGFECNRTTTQVEGLDSGGYGKRVYHTRVVCPWSTPQTVETRRIWGNGRGSRVGREDRREPTRRVDGSSTDVGFQTRLG